jgi:hypothetical protein
MARGARVFTYRKPRSFRFDVLMSFDPSGGALWSFGSSQSQELPVPVSQSQPVVLLTGSRVGPACADPAVRDYHLSLYEQIAPFFGNVTVSASSDTGSNPDLSDTSDSGQGGDWGGAGHGSESDLPTDTGTSTSTGEGREGDCDEDSDL